MKHMMKDYENYILVMILLLSCIYINFCTTIPKCACFFTLIISCSNFISERYGYKIALNNLLFCICVALCVLTQTEYKIGDKICDGLFIVSYTSIFMSFIIANYLLRNIRVIKLPLLVLVAGVIDGFVMSVYFYSIDFATNFVLAVFIKEITYKLLYSVVINIVYYTIKNNSISGLKT